MRGVEAGERNGEPEAPTISSWGVPTACGQSCSKFPEMAEVFEVNSQR